MSRSKNKASERSKKITKFESVIPEVLDAVRKSAVSISAEKVAIRSLTFKRKPEKGGSPVKTSFTELGYSTVFSKSTSGGFRAYITQSKGGKHQRDFQNILEAANKAISDAGIQDHFVSSLEFKPARQTFALQTIQCPPNKTPQLVCVETSDGSIECHYECK